MPRGPQRNMKGDNSAPAVKVVATHPDPEAWPAYAKEWFRRVFFTKDICYFAAYAAAFGAYVYSTEAAPRDMLNGKGMLVSAGARAALSVVFAVVALVTLWIDLYMATAPEPHDRKWNLVGRGFGGHFCFLTVHIVTTWAYYWPICAVAEVLRWQHGSADGWVGVTITAMYRFAVLSSSLGTVLTLLFLKFNWFEAAWRRDVLDMYEARGKWLFRYKILFTHLNQLPIAMFDCVVLKQTHGGLLTHVTPSVSTLLTITVAYCVVYLLFTHANYRFNTNVYPYPFMDKLFAQWSSELAFVTGLVVFVFANVFAYRTIAVESRYVEKLFLGA